MDRETDLTPTIDQVAIGSFHSRIGVGSDSDSNTNPDPLSESVGVDSTQSSSKSSNSIGGITSFAFHQFGGLEAGGGSANRYDY